MQFLLWGLLGIAAAQGGGVQFFTGSWETLLQEARKKNKPIFVDFYTVWCGPCKMLERHTFSNPEVGAYTEKNYIAYRIDAERGEGPRLANRFKIRAYPTLIFLDPEGNELGRQVGFVDAPTFLALLKRYQEKSGDKREEIQPSWENFQREYRVFFTDFTQKAWGSTFAERFSAWRTAIEQSDLEQGSQIAQTLPAPAPDVLAALAQWHKGQKESALHTLHHRLYQSQKLSPLQALWLGAYAIVYWDSPPPETIQWVSFGVKKEPSGAAFLTQAALYQRLGRVSEAKEALKEARRDLPADHPALHILTSLNGQK
ncbi:MAG: thioredoxin family protein [Bacteroidia bacterium]|nr:thioredoxin family protein [Bacteroidia bacterium]